MKVSGKFVNKFNSNAGRKIYDYSYVDRNYIWKETNDFREYQEYLKDNKKKIGAIVMNCNPFTLGHRYLIETASHECSQLYIFVVEEDRSIFKFEDRLALVQAGVKDLKNVTVLKSGHFIISETTFPAYFNKAVQNNISVDTSQDVTFFARYIAPELGINIRFVGEEPLDIITNQYNATMKEILPQYGIEFRIIKRKEEGGQVISASRVRKLLKEGKFVEIKELVPETTYEYLINMKFQ